MKENLNNLLDKFISNQFKNLSEIDNKYKIIFTSNIFSMDKLNDSILEYLSIRLDIKSKIVITSFFKAIDLFQNFNNHTAQLNLSQPLIISDIDTRTYKMHIIDNINDSNNLYRSEIIGKFYNYKKNIVEYKLSDGNYIEIQNDGKLKNSNIIELEINEKLFPLSFIKMIDKSKYRNIKINQVINE